jgi:hypothetical protein
MSQSVWNLRGGNGGHVDCSIAVLREAAEVNLEFYHKKARSPCDLLYAARFHIFLRKI